MFVPNNICKNDIIFLHVPAGHTHVLSKKHFTKLLIKENDVCHTI